MHLQRYVTKTKSKFLIQARRSRRSFRSFKKFFGTLFLLIFCGILVILKFIEKNNDPLAVQQNFIYVEPINSYWRRDHNFWLKKDYHDREYLEREKESFGKPGENGQPVYVDKAEQELSEKIFQETGYYGLVSDKIALNRSVADFRHDVCKEKKYVSDLPSVSVIIPFYNDHLSTLLRTIYSIINRSPKDLLKEVILVNDHSTKEFLYNELEDHIKNNFEKNLVKLYVLPKRSGLIWARLAGARAASGDVLLFLDSHVEASTNFLPPLLEPIAKDYRTCVCPFVDLIDFKTFQYISQGHGARGIFDWRLTFESLPLRPQDRKYEWENYENPVMAGGLFAISSKFFWELGGYDTGLDIWGGEQYELSFKIWLCGGKMYDTPCSRIGHVFRGKAFSNDRKVDFISNNYKRVMEVWMDEYKEYVYKRDPERYAKAETGDISYQMYLREKNKCKPFSYFMEVVAPDMLDRFPYVEPPEFASGAIQSLADEKFCLDTMNRPRNEPIGIHICASNKVRPQDNQHFFLRFYRDLSLPGMQFCFDVNPNDERRVVITRACHKEQRNQYFRYDLKTMQLRHGPLSRNSCIEADIGTQNVYTTVCDAQKKSQKWKWGFINETNLRNWLSYGTPIKNELEVADLKKIGY